VLALAASRA
jgi:hypothetical protein